MVKIDAIGDACPLPVIKAKRALKESSEIMISVDNEIATQNLMKMAKQLGYELRVDKKDEKIYQVFISSDNSLSEPTNDFITSQGKIPQYIVVIDGNKMGVGNDELGYALLKTFIYSLTEQDVLPSHVVFYNGGAKMTIEESAVLDDLKQLQSLGVEVLTCGACLDYFGFKDRLAVGEITNMYRIVELMSQLHVVKP